MWVYDLHSQRAVWKPQPNLYNEQSDNNIASAHVYYSNQVHVERVIFAKGFRTVQLLEATSCCCLGLLTTRLLSRIDQTNTIFIHICVFVFTFSMSCARHIQQKLKTGLITELSEILLVPGRNMSKTEYYQHTAPHTITSILRGSVTPKSVQGKAWSMHATHALDLGIALAI